MCGRFALHSKPEVVQLVFGLPEVPLFEPRYNIAPTMQILVVKEGQGKTIASSLRWGLGSRQLHNVRGETAAMRFRGARRCLVPANGFYEWKRDGVRKQPYYVRPANDELFAFAGLWEYDTCAVITTEANETVRPIHHRMPVVIARQDFRAWLAGADGLLVPCPPAAIRAHAVSLAVNRAANDSGALIEPFA